MQLVSNRDSIANILLNLNLVLHQSIQPCVQHGTAVVHKTSAKFGITVPMGNEKYCKLKLIHVSFQWIIHIWYFRIIWKDKESLALSPQIKQKYQMWIIQRKLTVLTPKGLVLFAIPAKTWTIYSYIILKNCLFISPKSKSHSVWISNFVREFLYR